MAGVARPSIAGAPPPPSTIREMPPEERPRQRLLRSGGEALADPEVLALILGNGCREVCSLELAREILLEAGGLTGLVGIRCDALQRRGLGEAKAANVLAALELARRLVRSEIPRRRPMSDPVRVARYLALRYGLRDQEVMGVLYLDVRRRLIGEEEVFRGALSRTTVEPRQVIGPAIARSAAGVVLFHNHPSGEPTPSLEDVTFTQRMAVACEAVGVELVDHLIVGSPRRWVSMRKHGIW